MRFGPTLIGAVVGAAVGMGIQVALEMGLLGRTIEAPWFAIVTGLLTGLGVRQANKSDMNHTSYARGAVAAIVALAAMLGSIYALHAALQMKDQADAKKSPPAKAAPVEAEADEAADEDAAEPADATPVVDRSAPGKGGAAAGQMPARSDMNPLQMGYMIVGALLAYQFARGAGPSAPAREPVDEPMMTDPSN